MYQLEGAAAQAFSHWCECRFENLPASKQDLTFDTFDRWCNEKIGLDAASRDVLTMFQMYSEEGGFTTTALLLSDQNSFNGISIVHFGKTTSEIRRSLILDHQSILDLYSEANSFLNRHTGWN